MWRTASGVSFRSRPADREPSRENNNRDGLNTVVTNTNRNHRNLRARTFGDTAAGNDSTLITEPLMPLVSTSASLRRGFDRGGTADDNDGSPMSSPPTVGFSSPSAVNFSPSQSFTRSTMAVRVDRCEASPLVSTAANANSPSQAFNSASNKGSFYPSRSGGEEGGESAAEAEASAKAEAIALATSVSTYDRIKQLSNIISEYFDEAGGRYFSSGGKGGADQASSALGKASPNLRGFAEHLKSIPFAGYMPTQTVVKKKEKTVAATRVANMIVDVGKLIQDRKELHNDIAIAIFSVLSIVLMLVENVVAWIPRTAVETPSGGGGNLIKRTITKTLVLSSPFTSSAINPSPSLLPTTSATAPRVSSRDLPLSGQLSSNALLTVKASIWLICVFSAISILFIILLYLRRLRRKQVEWSRVGASDVMPRSDAYEFWRSWLPIEMAVEVGIHLVCPYPWWNILDNSDAKYLELFMLLRLYTVLRLLHHASPLYRARREILRTNAELRVANFSVRIQDTFKLYFFTHTFVAGLSVYLLVSLIGGFVVYVAERDSNNGFDPPPNPPFTPQRGFNTLLDGIYFMVMSIRTVGYGDLRPITVVGRSSAVVFQFFGMAAGSVLGSVVINRISKSTEEKMVDEYLGAFRAWYELRVASAMLIQATWKTSIGYQARHGKISREKQIMARRRYQRMEVLRQAVRRQNTQVELSFQSNSAKRQQTAAERGSASFRDVVKAIREPDDNATSNLGLQSYLKILTRSNEERIRNAGLAAQMRARARARKAKEKAGGGGTAGEGYLDEETDLSPYLMSREGERFKDIYRRMPYIKPVRERVPIPTLVTRLRAIFSPEASMSRWNKNTNVLENPRGFEPIRTFSVSKKVIDRSGNIRHVPVGEGHKADIRLHALQQFRAARQTFNQTAGASSDHIVDRNLTIIFRMLVSASKKLKRNSILLQGLKRALITETAFTDRMIDVSLGGGYDTVPITEML